MNFANEGTWDRGVRMMGGILLFAAVGGGLVAAGTQMDAVDRGWPQHRRQRHECCAASPGYVGQGSVIVVDRRDDLVPHRIGHPALCLNRRDLQYGKLWRQF